MPDHAVFPGSFDPLTIAHLAIADAVHDQLAVASVDLAISRVALEKAHVASPVEERARAILEHRTTRPWLDVAITEAQLLADIAHGYDVLVIGADKWRQLRDPRFYGGSTDARDEAFTRLPRLAVAPRTGAALPTGHDIQVLDIPEDLWTVSSTAVRSGRREWQA